MYMYVVSPKGWYRGAPPLFNFKVYVEIQCFTTLIEQTSCTPPPLSLRRRKHCTYTCTYMYYKCIT